MTEPVQVNPSLAEIQAENVRLINEAADQFLRLVEGPGRPSREAALARTKIEEAVMWAVKGITG